MTNWEEEDTMRKSFLLIVALFLVVPFASAQDANKADLDAMQGDWQMVSGERDGKPLPEYQVKRGKRECKGNELTVHVAGHLILKATIMLDSSKDPKAIDYAITDGEHKGKRQFGIYRIADGMLTFCFAEPGHERPTTFETKGGGGLTLSVWKKPE